MSRRRNYSPLTLAAIERFFTALDTCIATKQFRNMSAFCEETGIDKRHLYSQRSDKSKGYFEIAWMLPLVSRCGISPMWLLTGKGTMFAQ